MVMCRSKKMPGLVARTLGHPLGVVQQLLLHSPCMAHARRMDEYEMESGLFSAKKLAFYHTGGLTSGFQ